MDCPGQQSLAKHRNCIRKLKRRPIVFKIRFAVGVQKHPDPTRGSTQGGVQNPIWGLYPKCDVFWANQCTSSISTSHATRSQASATKVPERIRELPGRCLDSHEGGPARKRQTPTNYKRTPADLERKIVLP